MQIHAATCCHGIKVSRQAAASGSVSHTYDMSVRVGTVNIHPCRGPRDLQYRSTAVYLVQPANLTLCILLYGFACFVPRRGDVGCADAGDVDAASTPRVCQEPVTTAETRWWTRSRASASLARWRRTAWTPRSGESTCSLTGKLRFYPTVGCLTRLLKHEKVYQVILLKHTKGTLFCHVSRYLPARPLQCG